MNIYVLRKREQRGPYSLAGINMRLASNSPRPCVSSVCRIGLSPAMLRRSAFRAVLTASAIFHALSAEAKLGETMPQLTKRFGTPYEVTPLYNGRAEYHFHEHGFDLSVVVKNNVSVSETYDSFQPLQPNGDPPNSIVRGILQTNVPGAKWRAVETDGRKEAAAFMTGDGKYRAGISPHVDRPRASVGSTFTVQVCTSDYLAKSVPQERDADAPRTAKTTPIDPGQQGSTVQTPIDSLQGNGTTKEKAVTANSDTRESSGDSVHASSPQDNAEVRHDPGTDIVYTDPDYEAFRKLTKEEQTAATQSMSGAEVRRLWLFLYKGRDDQGKPVPYTEPERKANAVLYSQACSLAMGKLGESFVRKLALDDPDGKTDNFVTKVVERSWGPRGRPRDWKDSNPPRQWLTQYKNVSFKVELEPLADVDRMNGWRWRGKVRFSAKYMRVFSAVDAAYFGESTSGRLRPGEWVASGNLLDVSLANRDGKWTLSASHVDSNLEYGKPSEAEMKEYDAVAEGTGSR